MTETRECSKTPDFGTAVEDGGYRWWYLDGISDDRQQAITIIVFVGSVFSPYYRRARSRGDAAAKNYCAVNVALYGRPGKRWAMTERGAAALFRDREHIRIGPSAMKWKDGEICLDINEVSVPWPAKIRGQIRLLPEVSNTMGFNLDEAGQHYWQPLFPQAQLEVKMSKPNLHWRGTAYFDTNHGSVPLENDFLSWDWSRMHLPGGGSRLIYDRRLVNGARHCLTVDFDDAGNPTEQRSEAEITLPKTHIWRIPRATRGKLDKTTNKPVETLEDTPFYARSLVNMEHDGRSIEAVHESLVMTRFCQPVVQLMLPFRMPRLT